MSAVSLTITIDRDQLMHKTALVKYCRLTLRVTMAPSKAGKGSNVTCTVTPIHRKYCRHIVVVYMLCSCLALSTTCTMYAPTN